MITQNNINQVTLWIMAAAIMLVIAPVIVGAAVLVVLANLHIVGCALLIPVVAVATYPRQSVKVVIA